jgi:hypothetical protein
VIDDTGGLATPDEQAAIDVFNDRLQAEGYWVFAGPFVESREHLDGFSSIEAPDLAVALKLATEGSKACNRKVEVRPFLCA